MSDKDNLKNILADLKRLFKKKEIPAKDFRSFLNSLQSKEVKNYLTGISKGSKPEAILREVFFTINSPLAQYLFKDVFPEVTQTDGFIDYLIKSNREEISLEIKPLFTGIFKNEKTGRVFSKLKKLCHPALVAGSQPLMDETPQQVRGDMGRHQYPHFLNATW